MPKYLLNFIIRRMSPFLIILILSHQTSILSFNIPQTTIPLQINSFHTHKRQINPPYHEKTILPSTSSLYAAHVIRKKMIKKVKSEPITTTQPMAKSVINLVKLIIGAGVLSLPQGVASLGDSPKALLPASFLMLGVEILSIYSFILVGRMCSVKKKATTLSQAWEQEVGHESSWIVALSIFILTFFVSTAYSIVLGDIFTSLANSVGMTGVSRHLSILFVTLCAVNPLCGLKSLSALTPFSICGIGGLVLTLLFMFTRLISGSYAPGGAFFSTLPLSLQPSFNTIGIKNILSPSTLVMFSLAASSYCCHFSAPCFYNELQQNTIRRFSVLAITSFSIVMAISVAIMSFGFLTFGGNCGGMILNNYSQFDFGAIVCRFLIAASLISGYPFLFKAMKEAFLDLLRLKEKRMPKLLETRIQPFLLSIITTAALLLDNVGFVVGLNGAIMGSAINYIFPSIMYLKSTSRRIKDGTLEKKLRVRLERYLNKFLVVFGVFAGATGAVVSIMEHFFPYLL